MRHYMVFTVEQKNLALGSAQLAAKSISDRYGRKSSTDDHHSHGIHFLAPTARVASEISVARPTRNSEASNDISAFYFRIGSGKFCVYLKTANSIRNDSRNCLVHESSWVPRARLGVSPANCLRAAGCPAASFCKTAWCASIRVSRPLPADPRASNCRADRRQ